MLAGRARPGALMPPQTLTGPPLLPDSIGDQEGPVARSWLDTEGQMDPNRDNKVCCKDLGQARAGPQLRRPDVVTLTTCLHKVSHKPILSICLHTSPLHSEFWCNCRAVTHLAKKGHLHVLCHPGSPPLGDMKHLCVRNSFLQAKHHQSVLGSQPCVPQNLPVVRNSCQGFLRHGPQRQAYI